MTKIGEWFGMTRIIPDPFPDPAHLLRHHSNAGAFGQGLGFGGGEGYHRIFGEAGRDLDPRQVLERDFDFATTEFAVHHLIDVRLGIVHAHGLA